MTREIAASRGVAPVSDFDWRISVADLAQDASFSLFPGIDRTFLITSGTGILLEVGETVTSLAEEGSVSFPGEEEVRVVLPQGPATAINLMTRRTRCSGTLKVLSVEGEYSSAPTTVAALVLSGTARTSRGEVLGGMDFILPGTDLETLYFIGARVVFVDILRS